jgi:hypothetical protein
MNPAALHLALNNFPPIIDFAALLVLVAGVIWRSQAVLRAALGLFVLASLIAIPVFLTGEPAEHMVRHLDGVSSVAIHPHEEAADWAFALLCAQGVLALAMLIFFRRRDIARWALVAIILVSALATVAVFRTAKLGGNIHHPETKMAR